MGSAVSIRKRKAKSKEPKVSKPVSSSAQFDSALRAESSCVILEHPLSDSVFRRLPIEIVLLVVQHAAVATKATQLLRISRATFYLATPVLYHTIIVRTKVIGEKLEKALYAFSSKRQLLYRSSIRNVLLPRGFSFSLLTPCVSIHYFATGSFPHLLQTVAGLIERGDHIPPFTHLNLYGVFALPNMTAFAHVPQLHSVKCLFIQSVSYRIAQFLQFFPNITHFVGPIITANELASYYGGLEGEISLKVIGVLPFLMDGKDPIPDPTFVIKAQNGEVSWGTQGIDRLFVVFVVPTIGQTEWLKWCAAEEEDIWEMAERKLLEQSIE